MGSRCSRSLPRTQIERDVIRRGRLKLLAGLKPSFCDHARKQKNRNPDPAQSMVLGEGNDCVVCARLQIRVFQVKSGLKLMFVLVDTCCCVTLPLFTMT